MIKDEVSVIMGIFNCADTLPQAIDSILAQTYTNWQLILCDDGSTDDTYSVAESYAERYPDKMILIRNEKNMHLAYSLNRCLEYADGEFIARMDGDDISLPERFEKQMEYLRSHPEIDLIGTSMRRFDENGIYNLLSTPENPDKYTLRKDLPFFHPTILVRKHIYDSLGGYLVSELTARCEDVDLWFRFFKAGFVGANIPEPLYLHRENETAIRNRTFIIRYNAFKVTASGFRLLGYPKWWIIRPAILMVLKSLIPPQLLILYRKFQARDQNG